ncbi:MAG TPA: metallopeptidase TldD-related protein [Blastocatellia bacterium]|nr:metallopeptidase TldD-related protein [Blastocatellia bacterium]
MRTLPRLPRRLLVTLAGIILLTQAAASQQSRKSIVLTALEDELRRAQQILKQKGEPAPYLISYNVTETQYNIVTATRGALQNSDGGKVRLLDVDVRVGDYQLDNTHRGGSGGGYYGGGAAVPVSIEDDANAIRSQIWMETDRRYKSAVERLIQIRANQAIKVEEEDKSDDLSRETPQTAILPTVSLSFTASERAEWEKKLKDWSALFNKYPDLLESNVMLTAEGVNKYFISTEGTTLQHGGTRSRIAISARTKAEDGMELYRYETFDAQTPDRLPNETVITAAIEKMAKDLIALRKAPVIEPYTGPAILSGRASGVFFHEIFGHRIEGHRQKDEDGGQTFTKQVNKPILPAFISVYDDPTLQKLRADEGEIDLNGYYQFDDEGVKTSRVTVVENGILKNFLMSRSPIKGFPNSNGHGRKSAGLRAVGRQGNLIVESSQTVSEAKLREMLIAECKKQGKPFGLIFSDISGGFTNTSRGGPQSFQVTPVMVYRVFTDGRPDELVRGVDLIGTPLVSFSKILATSDRQEVFNGVCGAESGWVPVSAVAPGILTAQIEVQKKPKSNDRLPILPPPDQEKPTGR